MTTRSRTEVRHGLEIEEKFGYSTGIGTGRFAYVAGQMARDKSGKQIPDSALNAKFIQVRLNIGSVLERLRSSLDQLVSLRVYVTEEVAYLADCCRLCKVFFGDCRPVGTVIPVKSLNDSGALIEISAIAMAHGDPHYEEEDEMSERICNPETRNYYSECGFSRTVRVGDHIFVSGQMAMDAGGSILHEGDLAAQFREAFANLVLAVEEAGGKAGDVVSTDTFLTVVPSKTEFEAICDAHRTTFSGPNRPAGSMVYVPRLPLPGAMVQVTGLAIVQQ
jgi:enamine deaminase RidA (YjgF/YER057c/UK114 family)